MPKKPSDRATRGRSGLNRSAPDRSDPATSGPGRSVPERGSPDRPGPPPAWTRSGPLLLLAAVALAYANSLTGPFVFDDGPHIVNNPTVRELTLFGPWGTPMSGRPLINLSFGLNFALGGFQTFGYHLLNLALHACAALALSGVVRRTLATPALAPRYGRQAPGLALACALIWAVHPLLTQAVTYVNQRAESFMGLFFLLTLYCAQRGWAAQGRRRTAWQALAGLACLLGVGCKEVIAAAPLMVLAYDRIFVHGSFGRSLRASPLLYGLLALDLALLALLVSRGGTWSSDPGNPAVTPLTYLLTQPGVVAHYLRLAFWPSPLVFDYMGWPLASPAQALAWGLPLAGLLAASLWACAAGRPAGFAGLWFFAILAPSSSLVPLKDMANEYRLYLPLAAPVALAVLGARDGLRLLARRLAPEEGERERWAGRAGLALALLVSAGLTAATLARNEVLQDEFGLWADTAARRPDNHRALNNMGVLRLEANRTQEAVDLLRRSLALNPAYAEAHNNLGTALMRTGRPAEALEFFTRAVGLDPVMAEAHCNLGLALAALGRTGEARRALEWSARLRPWYAPAHEELGRLHFKEGRPDLAVVSFREALRANPGLPGILVNLGSALAQTGRLAEAEEAFRTAADQQPGDAELRFHLGAALAMQGKMDEAVACFREGLALDPDNRPNRDILEQLLHLRAAPGQAPARP